VADYAGVQASSRILRVRPRDGYYSSARGRIRRAPARRGRCPCHDQPRTCGAAARLPACGAEGLLATRPEFTIPQEHNARTGFLDAEDAEALFAALPETLGSVARFLYLTGWRKSEVLSLTWRQVDFEAGVVRLDVGTTKSGEGRTFPFSVLPDLEALLRERWAARDGLFVFQRRGQRIKDFYTAWHAAVRRAAVQHVNGREVVVRPGLVGRIPHDFRRSAVRNLVRASVPEHVAMLLTGHKTRAVFDRYDIVNEHDLTEGVAKLAAFRQTNGKHPASPRLRVAAKLSAANDGGGSGLVA